MYTVLIARRSHLLRLARTAFSLVTLLTTGCAVDHAMLTELNANPALKGSSELQGLAYFPQEEDQCGPASLATVLAFNRVDVSPETLRPQLYIPAKGGTLAIELAARARRYGLLAYPLAPRLDALLQELDAGHPVLVMQNLGFDWLPRWHFAVAIGYDLQRQEIVLRSGPAARYTTDLTLFKNSWDKADNWAQVVLAPNRLPASASLERYMQAANALEQIGELQAANSAYQTANQHWPNSPSVLMGLGNVRYAAHQYADAARHFRHYIQHASEPAAGWNNLAYSLHQMGCRTAALQAVQCAISLAPQIASYRASLAELNTLPRIERSGGQCILPTCRLPVLSADTESVR